MEQSRTTAQRLHDIFHLMHRSPMPTDTKSAHKLLKESFNKIEAFELQNQMFVSPLSDWKQVPGFNIIFYQYIKHLVFISENGDIQIIYGNYEDSPAKIPLYFYNVCKGNKNTVFKKVHTDDYWAVNIIKTAS